MSEAATTAVMTHSAVLMALGEKAQHLEIARGEVTLTLTAGDYHDAMQKLHTVPGCQFEQLVDLCGVAAGYLEYQIAYTGGTVDVSFAGITVQT